MKIKTFCRRQQIFYVCIIVLIGIMQAEICEAYYAKARISGNYIVAHEVDTSTGYITDYIHFYDITSGTDTIIVSGNISDIDVDDDGYVAYSINTEVHLYDISSGVDTTVATDANYPTELRIDGDNIIYYNTSNELIHYSISSGVFTTLSASYYVDHCAISEGITLFEDSSLGARTIFLNDDTFGTGTYTQVSSTGVYYNGSLESDYPFSLWIEHYYGGIAVIQIYDANTGYKFSICMPKNTETNSADIDTTRRPTIVWEQYDSSTSVSDIVQWRLGAGLRVLSSGGGSYYLENPKISGRYVIWLRQSTASHNPEEVILFDLVSRIETTVLN